MLAGELLERSAARFPERAAIVAGDLTWTYRALAERAARAGNGLAGLGLAPGDRVAVLSRNLPDYAALYFGVAQAGMVLVNLSPRMTEREIAALLTRTGATCLIVDPALEPLATAATAKLSLQRIVIGKAFDALVDGASAAPPAAAVSPDDPYCVTFTGGTSGTPKGVVVTQRNRCEIAETVAREFGLSDGDRICVSTPLFHTAGLFVWFQPGIATGCTCVLLPTWDTGAFIDAVAAGASASLLVPTQLSDLLNHERFDPARMRALKRIVYAGAPIAESILSRLSDALPWVEFIENYGQSEIGPGTVRRGSDLPAKAGSIGRAIRGVEMAVLTPSGEPAQPGEVGELASRGPYVLHEYYGDPKTTADLFRYGDGWAATGDAATMDEDGFFTLVDRLKDMIVSGGENIYPAELEMALDKHPDVEECAVFGIPDDRLGEVPAAHVVLRDGAEMTAEALIDFCCGEVARYKRPRLVAFVDSLPRTAIGKIQKNLLREPYWQGGRRRV